MGKIVASRGNQGKQIEFLDGETVDVGIDTHKKIFDVTLWSERRGTVVKRWAQPADSTVTAKTLAPLKARIRRVVYEAGPCGYGLARALRQAGFAVAVVAPSRTPKTPGQESKSDRLDSRKLAMWSAKNLLQPVQIPSEEEEGDRQVFRMREQMVKKRRRVKQQIKSFLLMHGIEQPEGLAHWTQQSVEALGQLPLSQALRFSLDCLLADLAHFQSQFKKADQATRALARTKRHSRGAHAMQSVSGVGAITAVAMRTELIAPQRFDNGLQVASMVGLAPWSSQSGQTRKEGPLIKCGNARLRTILIEAAWRWVAKDPWAAQRFAQLARTTGHKKKAIAAMARRLAIILWRINLTGEPYRPRPCVEPTPTAARRGRRGRPRLPDVKQTKEAARKSMASLSVQTLGQQAGSPAP